MEHSLENILMIRVTNKCNNKCVFCCDRKPDELNRDMDLVSLTNYLSTRSPNEIVHIIGGEPTLFSRLEELILKLNDLGYKEIYLETNATILSTKRLKFFLENKVSTFIVGLHSVIAEDYHNLTGNRTGLAKCIENIKEILQLGGKVIVNIAIQKTNYNKLEEILQHLRLVGVKDFIICAIIPPIFQNYSFDEIVPKYSDIYPYLKKAIDANSEASIKLQYFPYCTIKELESNSFKSESATIHYINIDGSKTNLNIDWTSSLCEKGEKCSLCNFNNMCNGVFKDYIAHKGWDEFIPVQN